MNPWRVLLALSFLLLGGCLVTLREPIPANEPAPMPLLGDWSRKDEWGERAYLEISRSGSNLYRARTFEGGKDNLDSLREYGFTVAHHGRRWYLSAGLPKQWGANFAIAGFELTADNELVVYNLDVERLRQEVERGTFKGEAVEMPEGDGVVLDVPWSTLQAWLDDPANSDVFIEAARYQRAGTE